VKPELMSIKDLSLREATLLVPLALLTIYFGIHANAILDVVSVPTEPLLASIKTAVGSVKAASLVP